MVVQEKIRPTAAESENSLLNNYSLWIFSARGCLLENKTNNGGNVEFF